VPCLLSVDIESGFSDDPDAVADLAAELVALGVVGINIEDGRTDGTLDDTARHCAKIAAIKDRVPQLFVNARTDTFWLKAGEVDETLARVSRYEKAGADGIFVPAVHDVSIVGQLTRATRYVRKRTSNFQNRAMPMCSN
jgi:2-methylisocitrate lyase-like PEP mutase family enzyme